MKITIYVPMKIKLDRTQLEAIRQSYNESWDDNKAIDQIADEDIVIHAHKLGFVQLPDGWHS